MKKDFRFVFFGTPAVAVFVLDALNAHGMLPTLIVTAPDKPRGRGGEVSATPAAAWGEMNGVDVVKPATLKDDQFVAELQNTEWDFFVVAAYGKIISKRVLDIPRHGALNVHPSLLPSYRGPSPIMSAILNDDRKTGVTIMLMDEEMDHGPTLSQARIEIEENNWPLKNIDLEELLATEGGNLLAETIPTWVDGAIEPEVQNHDEATYTKKFSPEDARIDMSGDPRENLLKVHAFDRSPRAWMTDEKGLRVVITEATIIENAFVPTRVIPEGKKEMSYDEYRLSH